MDSIEEFNFPDFKVYHSDLISLDNFDFSGMTSEEVYYKYYEIAKTIPLCHKILKKEEFNELKFYRARLNIDHTKEDVSLISTFSFPPTIICSENGRANLKSKTVLYCADSPDSAIAESKPENGDEGYLSIWKTIAKRDIKACISLPRNLTELNKWSEISKRSFESYIKSINKYDDKKMHLNAIHHFVNFKFINEQKPYYISSIIANEAIYGDYENDFLIYMSVANDKFCNMAFHPNSALENLELEKIIKFRINDVEKGQINLGQIGTLQNSRIVWRERTAQDEKIFMKV